MRLHVKNVCISEYINKMLKFNFVSRICSGRSSCKKYGDKHFFTKFTCMPKETNVYLYRTYCERFSNFRSLKFIYTHHNRIGNLSAYRNASTEAAVKENGQIKTYFKLDMLDRKKQALRSVLMEIARKEDIPYALGHCYEFGNIAKVYSYPGESNNHFLLIEFCDKAHVQDLLGACQCKIRMDAFPVVSRLVKFEKKRDSFLPNVDFEVIEENNVVSSLKKGASISDLIEYTYLAEKLSELSTRLRWFFCTLIKDSISGLFPYCDVLPYGSSVNGIGCHNCELDVMIILYPEQVRDDGELFFLNKPCIGDADSLKKATPSPRRTIFNLIKTFFPGVFAQKIIRNEKLISMLKHRILKMDCNVSINNLSAVLMSEIIHFCGEIDSRVRPLLYTVKEWAKESDITYAVPGIYITNLVMFFLQTRPAPILPPFNDALVIVGKGTSREFRYLKPLEEFKIQASLNEESLAMLLKESFKFLGTYPFRNCIISLMTGKTMSCEKGSVQWVQYPFEEELNITKNVSDSKFRDMTEKAKVSAKYLETNLNQKSSNFKDLGTLFGISNFKRLEPSKQKKIDVGSLLKEHGKNSKGKVKSRNSQYRL